MAKQRRYTLEKKQEQTSRTQIKAFLEPFEWITGDIDPDLGEDIFIRIYENGISTGLSLYVQLKSVSNLDDYLLKSGVISYPIKVADLIHWEDQDPPVFLVVWDIDQSFGWWIVMDEAIKHLNAKNNRWRDQTKVQVHILLDNRLDENGLMRIRHILAVRYLPILAKGKELDIKVAFKFPSTPEGKTKREELKRHKAAGDVVEIEGKYIAEFRLSKWWTRLFGEMDPRQMKIWMGPSKLPIMQIAEIDFISTELGVERIPYVELCIVKQGREEITLSNGHQNIPYKFELIINGRTRQTTLNFSINFASIDVFSAQQALLIQQILANGARIQLTFTELNTSIPIQVAPKLVQGPNEDVIRFIENLYLVQKYIDEKITFPQDGSFSQSDVEIAEQLVSVVTTGVNRISRETYSVTLKKEGIQQILESHQKNEPIRFRRSSQSSQAEILNSKIVLGPFTQFITGMWDKPLDDVFLWLGQAKANDALTVRLIDSEIVVVFENWVNRNIKE